MKRLTPLLLVLPALLLLGGCALEPTYSYNANSGGGYYYGQSPYGNASTVIYGTGYASPWGWGGWGPGRGWGYGPGWWGYGGIGLSATYIYNPHRWHPRRWRRHGRHAWRGSRDHHWRHGDSHHHAHRHHR